MEAGRIVVNILVQKPVGAVWKTWTTPQDIMQWNIPFADWQCPEVMNDVREGGKFCFRMQTKDRNEGFDHAGTYNRVIPYELIAYTQDDGRKSTIEFQEIDQNTIVRESFEPEKLVPVDVQRQFCKSVLQRFKEYAEQA